VPGVRRLVSGLLQYVIVWFPPEAAERTRTFKTRACAEKFAASEGVAEWHPLMLERHTRILPLPAKIIPEEDA
jgi:hypothetical protein